MSKIALAKSPIIEVLAEFTMGPGANWNATLPGRLHSEFADSHPVVEQPPTQNFETTGPLVMNVAVQAGAGRVMFRTPDRLDLIQLGPGVFSVNRLAPYLGWSRFRDGMMRSSACFRRLVPDSPLVRISLTYLNRFDDPAIVGAPHTNFVSVVRSGGLEGLPMGDFFVRSDYRVSEDYEAVGVQVFGQGGAVFLALTDAVGGMKAVEVANAEESLSDWFESAHTRLCGAFQGCLHESLLRSLSGE